MSSVKSSPQSASRKTSPEGGSRKTSPQNVSRKPSPTKTGKGVQAHGKLRSQTTFRKNAPCPWLCDLVPTNVPGPGAAQEVLHPRKDVFILKVAKVGPTGDRRCKMELELVTPKGPEKRPPGRVDTRETQCDPEPPPCCCNKPKKKRK